MAQLSIQLSSKNVCVPPTPLSLFFTFLNYWMINFHNEQAKNTPKSFKKRIYLVIFHHGQHGREEHNKAFKLDKENRFFFKFHLYRVRVQERGGSQGMHEIELKTFPISGSSDRNLESSLGKIKGSTRVKGESQ